MEFKAISVDGVAILNCTPREITFQSKEGIVISPPCGLTLKAGVVEEETNAWPAETRAGIIQVAAKILPSDQGRTEYRMALAWKNAQPGPAVIVGSTFSAQVFPDVGVLVPVPRTERNPASEKVFKVFFSNRFAVFT